MKMMNYFGEKGPETCCNCSCNTNQAKKGDTGMNYLHLNTSSSVEATNLRGTISFGKKEITKTLRNVISSTSEKVSKVRKLAGRTFNDACMFLWHPGECKQPTYQQRKEAMLKFNNVYDKLVEYEASVKSLLKWIEKQDEK